MNCAKFQGKFANGERIKKIAQEHFHECRACQMFVLKHQKKGQKNG